MLMVLELRGEADKTSVPGAEDVVLAVRRGERRLTLTVWSGTAQVEVGVERNLELVLPGIPSPRPVEWHVYVAEPVNDNGTLYGIN